MNCVKCGKKATKRFSPDLDIQGIGTCKKCEEQVSLAYLMIIQGTPEMANDFTKNWKQPFNLNPQD